MKKRLISLLLALSAALSLLCTAAFAAESTGVGITPVTDPTGRSFVNIADVGGLYNDQWVQAISRWVTTVYGKPEPLPRTGY